MSVRTFTISHAFPGISRDRVRGFYASLDRIKEVHPLIVSIERVPVSHLEFGTREDLKALGVADPDNALAFRINDVIPIGLFLPDLKISYETVKLRDAPEEDGMALEFAAFQGSSLLLRTRYTFKELDIPSGGCLLEESCEVTGKGTFGWFVAWFSAGEAEKAHRTTNIKVEELLRKEVAEERGAKS